MGVAKLQIAWKRPKFPSPRALTMGAKFNPAREYDGGILSFKVVTGKQDEAYISQICYTNISPKPKDFLLKKHIPCPVG